MIESQLLQEFISERARKMIFAFLETRFGEVPGDLAEDIESVSDEKQLTELARKAEACPDLESFRSEVEGS